MEKEMRQIIESGEKVPCSCPDKECEWHGKCYECVLIHRTNQDHIPSCMHPMLKNKIKALAKVVELEVTPQE